MYDKDGTAYICDVAWVKWLKPLKGWFDTLESALAFAESVAEAVENDENEKKPKRRRRVKKAEE